MMAADLSHSALTIFVEPSAAIDTTRARRTIACQSNDEHLALELFTFGN